MDKCKSLLRKIRKYGAEPAARVVSILLVVVLAYQTALGTGVAYAVAEGVNTLNAQAAAADGQGTDGASGDEAASNGSADGSGGEQLAGDTQANVDEGSPQEGDGAQDEQGEGSSSNQASGDTGSADGANNEQTGADGSDSAQPGDNGTGEAQPGDGDANSGEDASTLAEREDARAWEGDLDALTLSSTGIVFSEEALTERDDSASASSEEAALPEQLLATLNLSLELDPAKWAANPANTRAAVIPGDTITVPLPEGIEPADEGSVLDVVQLNDDGTPTTIRIGTAEVQDGKLVVTFVAATDSETDAEYLVGAVPEGDGAEQPVLSVLSASIGLEVLVPSELVQDEATELTWTLQTSADDESKTQEATLAIPSRAELIELLGLASTEDETDASNAATEPAANEPSANALPAEESWYSLGTNTGSDGFSIIWCDNNAGSRPSTDEIRSNLNLQFSFDGQNYVDLFDANGNLTSHAISALWPAGSPEDQYPGGAPGTLPSWTNTLVQRTATNTYQISASGLPTQRVYTTRTPVDENGNGIQDTDENGPKWETTKRSEQIYWRIVDNNSYDGYIDGESTSPTQKYKMLTDEVTFTVVGKVGDANLKDIFGAESADDFRFGAMIDNAEQERSLSIADAVEDGWLTINETDTGCTITGTLPMYDLDGNPIEYFIRYTGEQDTEDFYQPSYDNSNSVSHGSAIDAAYAGGTMTLRHAGATSFHGTKIWLDGGSKNRPETTFTLWRYSLNGGSAATAAQVSLADSGDGAEANSSSYVQITIPANSADSVDLHALLVKEYGEAIDQLPKYDPDGYPYVYAMREEAVPGYEQVFGTVAQDGSINDTPPTYQAADGSWVTLDSTTRPTNDRFIYNGGDNEGEGVISNRLTGSVEATMTKTWQIAAFQDSLQDVVCTFQAQARPKGSTDDSAWEDVDSANATQTLTDWNAETLTKTITQNFPKYDDHGNELEYRWVETGVSVGADGENLLTTNEDGTGSFQITVLDAEGNEETLEFTSTPETTTLKDGDATTTITNTFQNITDQHVDKFWEQPDGSLAQVAPDPAYSDGEAVVELYQDGVLVDEFTLDGTVDDQPASIPGLGDATWQETTAYHGDFQNLPKYSEDGVRHTYLVLETSKDGWSSERSYDAETRTTRVDNYFPEGEGSEIRISKSWLDGDDAAHRYIVRIDLVAAHDMHSNATNPDGSYVVEYKAGETVATVELSESELWFTEIDVPIGGLTYEDFTAVETALVDDNDTPDDPADDTEYPVLTRDEAEDQYAGEPWVNAGWTNPDNRRAATLEHVYEVRSTRNDTLQSVEATNRRLGLFNLTVTKAWGDGLGDNPENNTRPDAVLTLSCDEYSDAFSVDEDGNLQVSVSANTLPVLDAEGNPVKATIVDADGNPAERGSAQVAVDTSLANSTYEFFGMPKYDASGMNVRYSVVEHWTGEHGDYQSSRTVGEYVVEDGQRHFQDHQTVEFSNMRSGTRDVIFYKDWHDAYVSETLGQRPDIYLTLYRAVRQADGTWSEPEVVNDYVHFLWEPAGEGGDAANEQMVTISGLRKYDSNGAEYVYYATESMSADGVSLGYGAVQFDYSSIDEADAQASGKATTITGAQNAVIIDAATEDNDPTQDGTGWAIREDGTFVNRLDSSLVAQGTKLWENIPGNMEQDDLPDVTVYLQRKRAIDTEWEDMYATVDAAGDWSVSGTVASTSDLVETTANQYTYTIETDYKGGPLPRFDKDGNLYEYRAVEIVWGLLGQPGGFTAEDIKGVNLKDIREGNEGATDLTGAVYIIQHGETGSFLLRNVYGGATGNLTVKKTFSGRDAQDKSFASYPTVTFDLYRYYVDSEGNQSAAAFVRSHTLEQADYAADDLEGGAGAVPRNDSATYTFKNLDLYAPDGGYWIYYVVERTISGYETTVAVGSAQLAAGGTVTTAGGAIANGMRSEAMGTRDATVLAEDETVDVTFNNAYTPGSVNLSGTKVWYDFNNIFSVRPDSLNLTFTRTAGSLSENVQIGTAEGDANYLSWQTSDTGNWIFTLSNVEQYAPNGQAWRYTVTEQLSDDAPQHYYAITGTSTVTAGTSQRFRLENALNGEASVEKSWQDGDDPYGLRPETVTVELQARYRTAETNTAGAGPWSSWQNAYGVWGVFASSEDLASAGLTEAFTSSTLSADNGWSSSWTHLPVLARLTANDPLNEIEYRVIETAVGGQQIANAPNDGGEYSDIHPYQPSQKTRKAEDANAWHTTITNSLDAASITASKSWKGDALNNVDDAWGTRPTNGDGDWQATYFLQSSKDNGTTWQWVVEAGSEAADSAIDPGVVSLVITPSMMGDGDTNHEVTANPDGSYSVTWKNLPAYDMDGEALQYRIVEQVPGSYDVTDATQVADADTAHRYYVVSSTNGGQSFENVLRTVDLTGTKQWKDYDSGFAPAFDENKAPTMVLYRAIKNGDEFVNIEEVKLKDGSAAPQPAWSDANNDGVWEFTYENLPAADENDNAYTYWAEEQTVGQIDGFYPVYRTADAEGTAVNGDQQANTTITNVATRFTLDKVSDWKGVDDSDNPESLNEIELSVVGADGKTYAVWQRDAGGTVTTWVSPTGGLDPDKLTNDDKMDGDAAGYIVGLKAGSYTITETGTVPDGYAKAPDVPITIAAAGSITSTTAGAVTGGDAPGIDAEITVTATDPVFRAHFSIHKVLGESGRNLSGVTFDLYSGTPDGAHTLLAKGITTNGEGAFTSEGSSVQRVDAGHGDKYRTLGDGLLPGSYYLEETATTDDAYLPTDESRFFSFTIDEDDHDETVAVTDHGSTTDTRLSNTPFTSTLTIKKYDTTSGDPIEGAVFALYRDTDADGRFDDEAAVQTGITTDEKGLLTITVDHKGAYQLVETANTGYDMTSPFTATFTVGNEDHNQTIDLMAKDGRDAVGFTVTQGTLDSDGTGTGGIENNRLHGKVTLRKRGANEDIDATFSLQMKQDDGSWSTIVEGLKTSNSYALTWNADGSKATASDAGDLARGQLQVTGLTWNTYKFVETDTSAGYLPENGSGALESGEFTIARETPSMSAGVMVQNARTNLVINKQNLAGEALLDAEFTITPVGETTFADGADAPKVIKDAVNGKSDGKIEMTGQLVVGGTYTIYESKAPAGYDPLDDKLTFTVQRDGSLAFDDDLPVATGTPALGYAWADADGDGQADNAFTLTVTDPLVSISLTKTNADGDIKLENAVFTLTGMCADGKDSHEFTTDADGKLTIDCLLQAGVSYTLTETTPAAGYIAVDPFTFSITGRGDIITMATPPAGWAIGDDHVSLTVADQPVELQITKLDPNGNGLFAAVFSITPVGGSTFADGTTKPLELRTGMNGALHAGAKLVVGGTYDITEESAPEGYERVTGTMRITVADDGTIRVLGSVGDDGALEGTLPPTGYEKVADNAFEVQVTNEPIEITINKVSAEDGGTKLNGAVFEITGVFADAPSEETREYTTASDGSLVGVANISAKLKSGETYTLRETVAPNGYELIQGELSFLVKEDGTIEVQGTAPAGYTVEQGNVSIVASDTPITVSFAKQNLDGSEQLAGAQFVIAGTFVNDATHELSAGLEIPFTTTGGPLELAKLPYSGATYSLVAGNTYTVTEQVAPAGYELVVPFSFTVGADGSISTAPGSTQAGQGEPGFVIGTDGSAVTLVAHDRPIEVKLQKRGSHTGDTLLADAVFDVYLQNADGSLTLVQDDVTTSANGAVSLTSLVGGSTYVLREVKAPAGHELVGDITFTVGTDGAMTIDGGQAGVAEDGTIDVVTVTDQAIEARLVKTNLAGVPLAGASFKVKPADGSSFAGSPELEEDGSLLLGPSGEDGIIEVPAGLLVAGNTYTLYEHTAPDGYELAGSVNFTVGTDGSIAIVGAANGSIAGNGGSGTYTVSADGGVAVLAVTDAVAELTVMKTANDGEGGQKTYLEGAEFTLTEILNRGSEAQETPEGEPATGQVLAGTTDANGRVSWTGLKANTSYVLQETKAPAGYELLVDTATLVVATDGTVNIADGNASGAFAVGADGVTIEVLDRHLGVSLVKTSLDGTGLAGGAFELTPAEGTFPDGSTSMSFTSDEFGTVFTDLMLTGSKEGTAYVLAELTAPDGYEVNEPITFLVYEDGTVAVSGDEPEALAERVAIVNDAADGIAVITVSDVPIELGLWKISTSGDALAGATFSLTGRFADGSTEHMLTVGDDGTVELPQTIAGETYTLTETAAPSGYDRIEGSWSFQVTAEGTIQATPTSTTRLFGGDRSAGYSVSDDGLAVIAVDARTPTDETLTGTGDGSYVLVEMTALAGLLALASGLSIRRRKEKRG